MTGDHACWIVANLFPQGPGSTLQYCFASVSTHRIVVSSATGAVYTQSTTIVITPS